MNVAYVEKMDGKQLRFAIHFILLGTSANDRLA